MAVSTSIMHVVLRIAIIIWCTAVAACAIQAPPRDAARGRTIVIDFRADVSPDMPQGTYRISGGQVLVSPFIAGFPYANVLTSSMSREAIDNISASRAAVRPYNDVLKIQLASEARRDLGVMLDRQEFAPAFTLKPDASATVLAVDGSVVLQILDHEQAVLFVDLNARLMARGINSPLRYVASVGPPRPLAGNEGWMANGAAPLNEAVTSALERALLVMLRDVSTPYTRDKTHPVIVEGYFPFRSQRLRVLGYPIADEVDWIAFSPSLPDGIQIMDKAAVVVRPASSQDRRIEVIEPD